MKTFGPSTLFRPKLHHACTDVIIISHGAQNGRNLMTTHFRQKFPQNSRPKRFVVEFYFSHYKKSGHTAIGFVLVDFSHHHAKLLKCGQVSSL
jgi:hypothetical protein